MIYTLSNNKLNVQFTTKGGALTSIKDADGLEYLWQGDATYWSGQSPVCFPICGSIRNDEAVTVDGKAMKMPRHGIVRKEEFQFETMDDNKICFSIKSNQKMIESFPFSFKLLIEYELIDSSIKITYKIVNEDSVDMPFFIGGHPGFNCPLSEGEAYSDYMIEFEVAETCTVPTPVTETGLVDMEHRTQLLNSENSISLEHSLFHKDAIIFDQLKSRKVKLCHKKFDKGVEVDFKQFPYLILWSSPNDGPFIAIEPWSGLSTCNDEDNVFEHKRNIMFVKSGETKELSFTITVL